MSYNSSHLRTSSINFSSIFEDKKKHAALVASKHSKRSGGDVKTVHTIGIQQAQTGDVTSNILAQLRRHSCQCEKVRLITHENILPNGCCVTQRIREG